eukprot:scaffold130204_cov19-Tisochrysis_lutea.AAC.1
MPSYLVTFLSVPRPNLATQCHFALESFAQMGMFLFDFALDLLLFVATTIALLASTTDPLQRLLHMLPIGARNQSQPVKVKPCVEAYSLKVWLIAVGSTLGQANTIPRLLATFWQSPIHGA